MVKVIVMVQMGKTQHLQTQYPLIVRTSTRMPKEPTNTSKERTDVQSKKTNACKLSTFGGLVLMVLSILRYRCAIIRQSQTRIWDIRLTFLAVTTASYTMTNKSGVTYAISSAIRFISSDVSIATMVKTTERDLYHTQL